MLARWRTLAAPPHYREETDWITAIHSEKGQARILLIGLAAFNAIVREAASSLPGAVLSDHHGFMQGRRYIDPFHFSPPNRAYQAGKTAGLLLPLLSARQEPPKEQECPKTRPEP